LVRTEYGDKYSLAEIAETWGEGISEEQVEALRSLEMGFELFDDLLERREVELPQVGD
jgi:hypothetical protein